MGHASCGAVAAALQAVQGQSVPGYVSNLVNGIAPAAREVADQPEEIRLANAIRANSTLVASQLRGLPRLAPRLAEGKLNIVAAYYELRTGQVSLLS